MGIDTHALNLLRDLASAQEGGARLLTLGRQAVNRPAERAKVAELAREVAPDAAEWPEGVGSFAYMDRLFGAMGLEAEALDISDYQGAELLYDLTEPLPEALEGRFDIVYDGGTTEHIFDLPRAFDNIAWMLADGGVFVSVNMLNGGPAHGLYQFGPELVWSYWKRGRGFEVLVCRAVPVDGTKRFQPIDLRDIGDTGKRPRLAKDLPRGRTHLLYAVRKTADAAETGPFHQGDYIRKWADGMPSAERMT